MEVANENSLCLLNVLGFYRRPLCPLVNHLDLVGFAEPILLTTEWMLPPVGGPGVVEQKN